MIKEVRNSLKSLCMYYERTNAVQASMARSPR